MRVSTAQFYRGSLDTIFDRQNSLARVQEQLATGSRLIAGADDPVGSGRLVALNERISRLESFESNLDTVDSRLSLEESVMASANDSLNRVRELAVQANNAAITAEGRRAIADEVRQKVEELLDLANARDANGEYLFSGTRTQTTPFVRNGADFDYQGNSGQRFASISDDLQLAMTDPGNRIFSDILDGNGTFATVANAANTGSGVIDRGSVVDPGTWVPDGYTVSFPAPDQYEVRDSSNALVTSGTYVPGGDISFAGISFDISGTPAVGDTFLVRESVNQSVFTTVQQLADGLYAANQGAEVANLINRSLANVDQAIAANVTARAEVGSRLALVDVYRDVNGSQILQAQELKSEVVDLDYAEAISRLEFESVALEAAQKSFLSIQRLSLFDFLR